MLTVLLSNISLIAQDKPYCFTDLEVKEIAYQLESRDILVSDTITYRATISQLNKTLINTKAIVSNQSVILISKSEYINLLESDIIKLQIYGDELESKNSKLQVKIKVYKHALPISLLGGGLLGFLIFK